MPKQLPQDVPVDTVLGLYKMYEVYMHRGLSFDWLLHYDTEGGNVVSATPPLSKSSLFFSKPPLSLFSITLLKTFVVTLDIIMTRQVLQ